MSSSVPVPSVPSLSLPARMRAGDALLVNVQTPLPQGALVFYVLTAVVGNVAVRQMLGAPGVAVDANGRASLSETSATTAKWLAGRYQWVLFMVDASGNRSELAEGTMLVEPDLAGPVPVDPRSHAEKVLGAIRAVIAGKATEDVSMYKIGGREVTSYPIRDLEWWAGLYEERVRRERIRKGQRVPNKNLGISFGGGA